MNYAIGVDIGGTHAAAAWVDLQSGQILPHSLQRRSIDKHASAHQILAAWTELLQAVSKSESRLHPEGIGFAIPGPFDYDRGISKIMDVGKYESLFGLDLKSTLHSYLRNLSQHEGNQNFTYQNLKVRTINDAEAFLMGAVQEWGFQGKRVVGITLGTGIGSAFFEGQNIVTSGEGVPPQGHLYAVPFKEHIAETYLSANWFERIYQAHSGKAVNGVAALSQMALQDPLARSLFEEFGGNLAQLLAPYLLAFQAEQIILAGNIAHSYNLFKASFRSGLKSAGCDIEPVVTTDTEPLAIQGSVSGLASSSPSLLSRKDSGQPMLPLHPPSPSERYGLFPAFPLPTGTISEGFDSLVAGIEDAQAVTFEGYEGVDWERIKQAVTHAFLQKGKTVQWYAAEAAFKAEVEIDQLLTPFLGGDDPVFGKRFPGELNDFIESALWEALQPDEGTISILYGPGAALAGWEGPLVYFDLPKNELQYRSRAGGVRNLGASEPLPPKAQYKRMYFVDWVVLNRHKEKLLPQIDFLCDAQHFDTLTWIRGDAFRGALAELTRHAFRARPWFEPGAWGGQWIKQHVEGLDPDAVNYAWSFELIVPENGLVLESDNCLLEFSFDFLMYHKAEAVLGNAVQRFGVEFPIRFDFLDTFEGGNLSVQCHPRPDYMKEHFGENFTQDETYYILDAREDATVYLGFQENIDPGGFRRKLEHSQSGGTEVHIPDYVQVHPAHKHDLFLIPSGTIHCSGKNTLVLEISSTPYIFTFKLYDWLRLDLDGKPRPINIARGFDNLQFDRKGETVQRELISCPAVIASGPDWQLIHLPTHKAHFYDVHRIEFDQEIEMVTAGSVHVLNLVEGSQIEVQTGKRCMPIHYAETFVIPAEAGQYTLVNKGPGRAKVIKAFIKPEAMQP